MTTEADKPIRPNIHKTNQRRCSLCGDLLPTYDELREDLILKIKHEGEKNIHPCELKYANGELCEYCAFNDD